MSTTEIISVRGRRVWDSRGRPTVEADFCFSLAQKSRIESRIASPGNRTLGGCQASENIALAGDEVLAKLRCIPITAAHNIVGPRNASWGKFFLVLLQTFEHVVC
jgi:enolase